MKKDKGSTDFATAGRMELDIVKYLGDWHVEARKVGDYGARPLVAKASDKSLKAAISSFAADLREAVESSVKSGRA